jgi:hypothetical protein
MKQNIDQAYEILNGATGRYGELLTKMQEEIKKVKKDEKFSEQGKQFLIKELKNDFTEDLLKLSQQIKSEYQSELQKAKSVAEKSLDAPLKKPDEKAVSKYRQQVEDLKTRVMLSLQPESAKGLVEEFVKGISDPYFANEFRNEFATVITPIISTAGQNAGQIKHDLAGTYEHLGNGFLSDEQREAQRIIETADSMMKSRVFNYSVLNSVNGEFGADTVAKLKE